MTPDELRRLLDAARLYDPNFAVRICDALLATSAAAGASDLHLTPTADGLELRWRIDGVLAPLGSVRRELAANVVTRLKVLARLLTYQTGVPQEGRITREHARATGRPPEHGSRVQDVEVRISTFPTVFGEKVVARNLPRGRQRLERLADLALPDDVMATLAAAIGQTSGAVMIAGPAGSGKTTTAYACLREILATSKAARSVASLEDPIEAIVPGVAQSQVNEAAGFGLHAGLRSLVRQDPEVIFVGEIRDASAAEVAMQAALTGQLVVTTFHAADAATAASRLLDMGIPPYVVRSGVRTIVAQRLLRRLCSCADEAPTDVAARSVGVTAARVGVPQGCEACRGAGYAGRVAVAEALNLDNREVAQGVLERRDARTLRDAAITAGMRPLASQAADLVARGVTSAAEVVRVFGLTAEPMP